LDCGVAGGMWRGVNGSLNFSPVETRLAESAGTQ
jgi:hypothetical protein